MPSHVGLETAVQYVRGVGPVRALEFAGLGVHTVADLIEYFPFRHELKPKSVPIGSLEEGVVATVVGELRNVRTRGLYSRQTVNAQVVDGTGRAHVRWFNSPHMVDMLRTGQIVRMTGKVEVYRELASFTNPQLNVIDDDDDPMADDADRHDPVYPGTGKLPSKQIARILGFVLDDALEEVVDFLPEALRTLRQFPPRRTAILRYHRPTSPDDVAVARRRLAYDEFFLSQLALQLSRHRMRAREKAKPILTTEQIDRRIRDRFPFALTEGQDRALVEICEDLAKTQPMNRLLQADVGVGKTAVAVYAALTTIANRRQVAVLAPTEVLANQHRAKIDQYLRDSRVATAYLAGSTTRSARAALLKSLEAGDVDLVIGTHALLEEDVAFRDLGLVIVDEQHKFGVAQRASLRRKGRAPHTLVLSATPIPRTLAMTMFGGLDVSTIDGAPANRQPIVTRLVTAKNEEMAWGFVRTRLDAGERAFIVYPLVDESESLPLKAARVEIDRLSQTSLAGYRIGLLHGRMKPAEKAEVMDLFRAGELSALVSTTVIEVGVDVPDATVMVIQHAERYGLTQLHQLRGRIGRGSKKSYCLLFGEGAHESSLERLRILCETSDGFRIAEEDLRLRGPGELMGPRQHGAPVFKVADLVADFELLEQARDDVANLLRSDQELSRPEHRLMRKALAKQYGKTLDLIDVA